MKVTIPSSIKEAQKALSDLDDLVTAKEWHRAALVWAFTHDARRGKSSSGLSVNEFVARKIHGLSSKTTVAAYRAAWEKAMIDYGVADVQPGDRIDLPTVPFPKRSDSGGGSIRSARAEIKRDADQARELVKDPEVAKVLAQALAEDKPAAIASAVAASPNAVRAIVRNDQAREQIGDESIEHQARYRPGTNIDPAKVGRAAGESVRRAIGADTDAATDELRAAARMIVRAASLSDEFGITDEVAEAAAIKEVEKALRAYKAHGRYTAADEAFLAEYGMVVE